MASDWRERGTCVNVTREQADWFFSVHPPTVAKAEAICTKCNVRAQCLAYAMKDPTLVGVWGGTSARYRRRLRRGNLPDSQRKNTTPSTDG